VTIVGLLTREHGRTQVLDFTAGAIVQILAVVPLLAGLQSRANPKEDEAESETET